MTTVNYHGPVAHTRAFLPTLVERKSGQIVIISSVAGILSAAYRTSYSGSKAAIIAFFNALRAEIAEYSFERKIFKNVKFFAPNYTISR